MTRRLWIVDTNIVVSGLLAADARSPAVIILDRMLRAELRFALCEELAAEYRRVLLRPRISRLHGLDEMEIDRILKTLITHAVIVEIGDRNEMAPDPGDNHLWRLLAACPGAVLVSGDRLLLENPPQRGTVCSAADCLSHEPRS